MDQKFSVQIYSTSFKLTVRKEQLDEGYSSNPEIEMEAKEQQCEPVLHGGAAREGFVQAGHPPPVQSGHPPPAQVKERKREISGLKIGMIKLLPSSGQLCILPRQMEVTW